MAVQGVQDVTLTEIPDLDRRVSSCREQEATIRVEVDFFDDVRGCIVVLDGLLTADVEDFDNFVGATASDAGTIWVELDRLHALVVVVEGVDQSLRGYVPHLDSVVFGTRGNKPRVRGEKG